MQANVNSLPLLPPDVPKPLFLCALLYQLGLLLLINVPQHHKSLPLAQWTTLLNYDLVSKLRSSVRHYKLRLQQGETSQACQQKIASARIP